MVALVGEPFSEMSPLKLRPGLTADDVAEVPMFRMFRQFLQDLQAVQPLKLTPKGQPAPLDGTPIVQPPDFYGQVH
ncbi:MAG: hypothetical protein IPM82_11015 [Saprospiraceae bacterium]|nr:hypothetical protein [Saprospiraceae bacterium]